MNYEAMAAKTTTFTSTRLLCSCTRPQAVTTFSKSRPQNLQRPSSSHTLTTSPQRQTYATAALATVPAPSPEQIHHSPSAIERYSPTQPPSYKPPELRKSQLLRSYTSLLRSTPLMLIFQHNNLRALEWAGIRRELAIALRKAEAAETAKASAEGQATSTRADTADSIRLQVIQSGIFAAALRVAEFYTPGESSDSSSTTGAVHATDQDTTTPHHDLSHAAYLATRLPNSTSPNAKLNTPLHALLSGPLAIVTFPTLTPSHLSTVLRILSPTPGASSAFPAPRRRDTPGLYETPVQNGLQKLMLLGARAEGRVLDQGGVRWVGGLEPVEALRARLVGLLTGVGMGVTGVLEGAGRSLWIGLETRRLGMEEEAKGGSGVGDGNAGGQEAKA